MGLCVERGDFRKPPSKPDVDFGKFTIENADIPVGSLRKKGSKNGGHKDRRVKNIRLTPISEGLEEPTASRDNSFMSTKRDGSMTPCKSDFETCSESLTLCLSQENSFERSDTPMNRKHYAKLLLDACENVEDELERICEDSGNKTSNQELLNRLTALPPRPRCKRKVLPPSVTDTETPDKVRAKKLLTLRKRIESRLQSHSVSSSSLTLTGVESVSPIKDIKSRYSRLSGISSQNENRPKSAESDVRVIRLADLASGNSSSVPDLPSILSKLSDRNDSKMTKQSSPEFDDSGALSTPRQAPEPPLTLAGWDKNCLKGSDMSSFYNMWERDRNKRPFGKKSKKALLLHRSCKCSLKKCADKLGHEKGKCLPPIPPAQG